MQWYPATLNHENKTITVTMIIIKEHAYFELTPDIALRLARYVLRQRSRQLKIKEKMGYNYLFNLNIQLQVVTPFLVLGAVHKLCCLKIGKFWPPPPLSKEPYCVWLKLRNYKKYIMAPPFNAEPPQEARLPKPRSCLDFWKNRRRLLRQRTVEVAVTVAVLPAKNHPWQPCNG